MADVEELFKQYVADQALNRAGSLMGSARAGPREATQAQGPLMSTILQALLAGGLGDPLSAAGGGGGLQESVLGPIARTGVKAMDQAQKKTVKAMFRHDPESLLAAVTNPRQLDVLTPGVTSSKMAEQRIAANPVLQQSQAYYQPPSQTTTEHIVMNPLTLKGRMGRGGAGSYDPSLITSDLPEVAGHELQHFLNEPRVSNLSSWESSVIWDLLHPFLSEHGQRAATNAYRNTGRYGYGLSEALSYLSGKGTRNPEAEDVGAKLFHMLKVKPSRDPGFVEAMPLTAPNVENTIEDLLNSVLKGSK